MRFLWTAFVLILFTTESFGGGVSGNVKDADGKPLGYASIYVKQTGSGAATDADGRYEISLAPGTYDLVFRYLGYESVDRQIVVTTNILTVDVVLKAQVMELATINVSSNGEDPAYTIMRKAIAKAKYHVQQLDKYSARVYMKGKGKLTDYPWFAKRALEKEGITKDRLFISESVSEIKYTRPNKFEEKVVAVFTTGKDRNTSPNAYIFGSFYQPEIAEAISPLSPKAFSYYRFEYLGTVKDQKYDVSKIKVTPRSKGDNLFEGILYIVDDWWAIHSLDFTVSKMGIKFQVKQIYNPIEDKAWLPVSNQFQVDGKVFGFQFEFSYLATVKDYKITMNPDLPQEMTIIDEKLEKEEAKKLKEQFSKKGQQLHDRLMEGKEVTNKELRKLVKEYEKQEKKEDKQPDVLSENTYMVDSLAYKKDSTYWEEIRPSALDKEEVRGYRKNDSISTVERKREEGDSLKPSRQKGGFQVTDLIAGNRYPINKTSAFQIHTPFGGYNTVEGFNVIYKLGYNKRWVKRDTMNPEKKPDVRRLEITPVFRYAFSRKVLSGFLRVDYRVKDSRLTMETGRYVKQYNGNDPIHPFVNTFTTLLLGDNYMKLYERYFADLNFRQRFDDRFSMTANLSWARRFELTNHSNVTVFKSNNGDFTPNAPLNYQLADTHFEPNTAFIGNISLEARPWQKYRIRNGSKYRVETGPVFSAMYRKGFDGALGSVVKFDQIEAGLRETIKLGIRGKLDLRLRAGMFLNADKLYFMDFQHFTGNRTPFVTTDPVGSFRLMDYYKYSTSDKYFSANVHYNFRKFLVTRIPMARLTGISENLIINYLATPTSSNYTEIGYGINGILRIFRLEGIAAFRDGKYIDYGVRLGITTNIAVNFGE